MINTILFDLDGTLLPLKEDEFLKAYFGGIAQKFVPLGFNKDLLLKAIWVGTEAMWKNNGEMTNEERFWVTFKKLIQGDYEKIEKDFLDFYKNDFEVAKKTTMMNPLAKKMIELLKSKGYKIAIATNPVFPRIATLKRIEWAGLNYEDFEIITTYEDSSYCKPNLKYYEELLKKINRKPEDCLMIGNDAKEDMVVNLLNMKTYLVLDCLINSDNLDISKYAKGSLNDLFEYLNKLPNIK